MDTTKSDKVLRSLRRIVRAIDLHSKQLANTHGLTTPQLVCLRELSLAGELGPGQLARLVDLSQATVTGITDRLARNGLLTRDRGTNDRRRVVLRLTPKGEELVASAPSPLQERFSTSLAKLPAENQQIIVTVLDQIVSMMGAEQVDASPLLASGPPNATASETEQFLENAKSATPLALVSVEEKAK